MKVPRQVSLKHLAIIVISTILLTGFVFYVLAATPSSTFWISPGVYPGAPSYTIFREDSNYFAKDANGEIEFSGTNASEIINNAIGSGYVNIFLKIGRYSLTAPIDLTGKRMVHIIGESAQVVDITEGGSILEIADNVNIDAIIKNETSPVYGEIYLKDFAIYGNRGNNLAYGNGIYFYQNFMTTLDNVLVTSMINASFYFESCEILRMYSCRGAYSQRGLYFESGGEHYVYAFSAPNNFEEGIYVYSTIGTTFLGVEAQINQHGFSVSLSREVRIIGCRSSENDWDGLQFYDTENSTVADSFFVGNSLGSANTYYGIRVTDNASHNIFSGNQAYGNQQLMGFRELLDSDYNTIIGCRFEGTSKGISINGTNTHTIATWNGSNWIS